MKFSRELYDDLVAYLRDGKEFTYRRSKAYRVKGYIKDKAIHELNGKLYAADKEIISEDKVKEILQTMYDDPSTTCSSAQPFYNKTKKLYVGITRNMIQDFLNSQRDYQVLHKPPDRKSINVVSFATTAPNDMWELDGIKIPKKYNNEFANNGIKWIYNIVDHFSKYAWSVPTTTKKSAIWLVKLEELFKLHGAPKRIHADNEFNTEGMKELCARYGTIFVASNPYRPNSNGLVERFNYTLKRKLVGHLVRHNDYRWLDALPLLVYNYNHTTHSAHGMEPNEVYFTKDKEILKEAKEKFDKYRAKKIDNINLVDPFDVGDKVRVHKLGTSNGRMTLNAITWRGYEPGYDMQIDTIEQVRHNANGTYTYRLSKKEGEFAHHELLRVNNDTKPEPTKYPDLIPIAEKREIPIKKRRQARRDTPYPIKKNLF